MNKTENLFNRKYAKKYDSFNYGFITSEKEKNIYLNSTKSIYKLRKDKQDSLKKWGISLNKKQIKVVKKKKKIKYLINNNIYLNAPIENKSSKTKKNYSFKAKFKTLNFKSSFNINRLGRIIKVPENISPLNKNYCDFFIKNNKKMKNNSIKKVISIKTSKVKLSSFNKNYKINYLITKGSSDNDNTSINNYKKNNFEYFMDEENNKLLKTNNNFLNINSEFLLKQLIKDRKISIFNKINKFINNKIPKAIKNLEYYKSKGNFGNYRKKIKKNIIKSVNYHKNRNIKFYKLRYSILLNNNLNNNENIQPTNYWYDSIKNYLKIKNLFNTTNKFEFKYEKYYNLNCFSKQIQNCSKMIKLINYNYILKNDLRKQSKIIRHLNLKKYYNNYGIN